jgi:8-oxo-dGTP pyrophosphatase MutT (NUDIX family)
MIVRFTRIGDGKSEYGVPKKRLDDKLEAAYRELFPDAADEKAAMNEDGAAGGGAASCSGVDGNGFGSGEFVQPLFGEPIRRNGGKKKTAKGTTGGNPYTESSVMEVIDRSLRQVLRENRQMISETEHPGMETDESAAAYIYASDKNAKWHILAARRASGDEVGKWNPPMGHRTKGESFMNCARRECMEESGFDISRYASMTKLAGTFDWGREYAVVIPSEVGTIETLPKPGNGDGENSEFIWVPINKIGSLDWAWDCDKHAMTNFRNHVKHG